MPAGSAIYSFIVAWHSHWIRRRDLTWAGGPKVDEFLIDNKKNTNKCSRSEMCLWPSLSWAWPIGFLFPTSNLHLALLPIVSRQGAPSSRARNYGAERCCNGACDRDDECGVLFEGC